MSEKLSRRQFLQWCVASAITLAVALSPRAAQAQDPPQRGTRYKSRRDRLKPHAHHAQAGGFMIPMKIPFQIGE